MNFTVPITAPASYPNANPLHTSRLKSLKFPPLTTRYFTPLITAHVAHDFSANENICPVTTNPEPPVAATTNPVPIIIAVPIIRRCKFLFTTHFFPHHSKPYFISRHHQYV